MKRSIPLLLIMVMVFSLTFVHAQRRKRLAFEKSDLLFYLKSGYPKVPEVNTFGLGDEMTSMPPIGAGFQLSIIDYLSFGPEFIFTYQNLTATRERLELIPGITSTESYEYRKSFLMMGGNVFLHYPFRVFDPYIGGGGGYAWARHETVYIGDYSFLYWNAILGFRLALGSGSPFGIFAEASIPYPLVSGGIYFRFRLY